MNHKTFRIAMWGVLIFYVAVLLTLTHLPKPPGVFEGHSDKTLHFLAYTTLACLSYIASALTWSDRKHLLIRVFIACAVFGALDESTQPFFGRHADIRDYLFDLLGIGSGLLVGGLIRWVIMWCFVRETSPA